MGGKSVEIHAGKFYVEFGLEAGLQRLGTEVRRPLAHVVGPRSTIRLVPGTHGFVFSRKMRAI